MYLRPHHLGEAVEALAAAPALVLSGGTDVFPTLVDRPSPVRVIDISALPGLAGITADGAGYRIGARTTWAAIANATRLPPAFDALRGAARDVGSVQIQNVATIGGNLCTASPAADGVPPLFALDASVELASRAGTRRLPLGEFLLDYRRTARRPDELLTAILIPPVNPAARSVFLKLGARRYLVISIAMVAATLDVEDDRVTGARIAVGSCSAVARRLPELEAALVGARSSQAAERALPEHLRPLSPIDDVRASAPYRDAAALELVRRALARCVGA